ncbi:hypothetical protein JMUB6875_63010 [Nocardia sp. JMUB6875]
MHLVGGPSAAEALRAALNGNAEHAKDFVEWFPDDLSAGPLDTDAPAVGVQRRQWWQDMVGTRTGSDRLHLAEKQAAFWERADAADHLVVWYGCDNAGELSLFHALCDKLPGKPFDVVGLPGAIGARTPDELAHHLAAARPVTADERAAARRIWQRLKRENQTFRVISSGELVSASADHYDSALLAAANSDWTPIVGVVASVMAEMNVADSPLFWRVRLLVESGALVADGDPWLVRQVKVKRAQPQHSHIG